MCSITNLYKAVVEEHTVFEYFQNFSKQTVGMFNKRKRNPQGCQRGPSKILRKTLNQGFCSKFSTETSTKRDEIKLKTFFFWRSHHFQPFFKSKIESLIIIAVIRRGVYRVCGAHLRVIAPAGHTAPFEEMLQQWQAVGTVPNLTGLRFEPQTSRSREKRVIA